MITGLTATSKQNFQLDAGAIYKNFVVGTDTPATASAKLIGATEGGATLAMTPEVRQITVDGAKAPTKGLEIIEGWTATLTATIKEVTSATIQMSLGSSTTATSGDYTVITPSADVLDTDYVGSIVWIGKIVGKTKPVAIELKNVLSLNGLSFAVKDKGEGSVPVVLTAHYDPADLDAAPVKVYIPTA